ncbi:MAG: iron transporter [Halolamina sp.]|uniref:iron transporter n=1 Tax=Halolamina sp. TaxID=1940283 RepID=UPI002FC39241
MSRPDGDSPPRRAFLAGLGAAGLSGLAGCAGFSLESSNRQPPLVENRPDGVYYPTHVEGMQMSGMGSDGAYKCALTYTYPHRFWTITGTNRNTVTVGEDDSLHLMPVVWHAETGIVTPDVNPNIAVAQDGERVTEVSPWPMLSQPMGFHFGDNVQLPGEGSYEITVSVGEPGSRRTGSLADAGSASFEFSLDYQRSKLDELSFTDIPEEKEGTLGAVPAMGMEMVPSTAVPEPDALPGTLRETGTSGDAEFAVTTLERSAQYGGSESEPYLAVSPRTRYNGYTLPLMSLSATLERDGETVYDDVLRATVSPELDIHYGAAVPSVETGDDLTIIIDAPTQASRHEGYETAFLEMEPVELTL